MRLRTLSDLQQAGLVVPQEPTYIAHNADGSEHHRTYGVHVTGPNHKNHRSTLTVFAATDKRPESLSVDRPWCGSASRWGAIQNTSLNTSPVTCGRCGPCSERCPVEAPRA